MDYKICRDKNKGVVKAFMKQAKRKAENAQPLSESPCLNEASLQMMYLFAKMREACQEHGMSFGAYFISDDKKFYMVSSLEE